MQVGLCQSRRWLQLVQEKLRFYLRSVVICFGPSSSVCHICALLNALDSIIDVRKIRGNVQLRIISKGLVLYWVLGNQMREGFSVHDKQDWAKNRPLRDTE